MAEMIVVVMILGALAFIAIPRLNFAAIHHKQAHTIAKKIVTDLRRTRTLAISNAAVNNVGFQLQMSGVSALPAPLPVSPVSLAPIEPVILLSVSSPIPIPAPASPAPVRPAPVPISLGYTGYRIVDANSGTVVDSQTIDSPISCTGGSLFKFGPLGNLLSGSSTTPITVSSDGKTYTITVISATGIVECTGG